MQQRNWCFTDFELLDWNQIYEDFNDIIRYIIWGKERCPKTNKDHYQGFIQFINQKRLIAVKKISGSNKIHLEACKGTVKDNMIYCQKEGNYREKGKAISQGYRSDLEDIKNLLDKGSSMKDIADFNFGAYCRYRNSFERYKQMVNKNRTKEFRKVEVIVIKGPTGCGKTRRAVETSKDHWKVEGDELQWFDGYEGEETIVIDEYDNQINCTKLLGLLDGYQRRLPIKGGFTYANWKRVILTSNNRNMHTAAKAEHQNALKRRITKVINFFKNDTY